MKFSVSAPLGVLAARTGQTSVIIITQTEAVPGQPPVNTPIFDAPMEEGAAAVTFDVQPGQRLVIEPYVNSEGAPK